jgi:hypothetical protein
MGQRRQLAKPLQFVGIGPEDPQALRGGLARVEPTPARPIGQLAGGPRNLFGQFRQPPFVRPERVGVRLLVRQTAALQQLADSSSARTSRVLGLGSRSRTRSGLTLAGAVAGLPGGDAERVELPAVGPIAVHGMPASPLAHLSAPRSVIPTRLLAGHRSEVTPPTKKRERPDRVTSGKHTGPLIDYEAGRGSSRGIRTIRTMTPPWPPTANFADSADSAGQSPRANRPPDDTNLDGKGIKLRSHIRGLGYRLLDPTLRIKRAFDPRRLLGRRPTSRRPPLCHIRLG